MLSRVLGESTATKLARESIVRPGDFLRADQKLLQTALDATRDEVTTARRQVAAARLQGSQRTALDMYRERVCVQVGPVGSHGSSVEHGDGVPSGVHTGSGVGMDVVATGVTPLDAMLGGGLRMGHITEVCARPGCGKTQLCLTVVLNSIADSIAQEQVSV
jgi:RecA/RadA recombinase